MWEVPLHSDWYAGNITSEKKSEWKNYIVMSVHAYNCTQNSATGFSPYYLMYGRQHHLPVDVTLSLAPHTTTAPNTSKCVQKMREHAKWAHKKAEAFQAKEAQCHKRNYDKRSKAAALEVGDTVLVHVTAFKGCHKIQDRWENREYVVEKWPYPNVLVYVVCPSNGEGCSRPYIGTICFLSTPTQGRMRRMHSWQELRIPTLQLQHHLWTVSLLMQDCLGWSHQAQQVAHPRVFQINLLHLDVAHKNPEPTSMEVPEFWFAGRYQSIWHMGCIAVSVTMSYPVHTLLSGEVLCEYTLLIL